MQPASATALPRTICGRVRDTPFRRLTQIQANSAAVLLAAAAVALVWANVNEASYEDVWQTVLRIDLASAGIELDLRHWVNSGLMTFYFLVFGLEARREFDLGELRERRRFALPLLAALMGMTATVLIYLSFNFGHASAYGWAIAMSTDTAFALGLLALVGPRFSDRLRAFILTIVVVDDIVALVVIATFYTEHLAFGALLLAVALFGAVVALRRAGLRRGVVFVALGGLIWIALFKSGVEPVVVGLAMGLVTYAHPAKRPALERATARYREFREQPTPAFAHSAREGLRTAISPNDRLQQLYHPFTSYVIVPTFALANAGIVVDRDLVARGLASPITLGILFGYLLGKPVGILGATWVLGRLSPSKLRPPVGWAAIAGAGTLAGIGFTVSLLVASLAFDGPRLEEAKLGILAAALSAAALTWLLFRSTQRLPRHLRTQALLGTHEPITDLYVEVNAERDHIRGARDALVTIVEYGDYECLHCAPAESVIKELLRDVRGVRHVWRHSPLTDLHPNSQRAAEAAEAAAAQNAFWPMHELLLAHQAALTESDLVGYAARLGLDLDRFADDLENHSYARRVAEDVEGADLSGVAGTPTFFINGRRHDSAHDIATLSEAVESARRQAAIRRPPRDAQPVAAF